MMPISKLKKIWCKRPVDHWDKPFANEWFPSSCARGREVSESYFHTAAAMVLIINQDQEVETRKKDMPAIETISSLQQSLRFSLNN